jgi:hypothetical protein
MMLPLSLWLGLGLLCWLDFLVCVLFCVLCEQWDSTHVKLPCSPHNHLGAVFGKWYVMTAARSQPAAFCFVGTLNCVHFVVW